MDDMNDMIIDLTRDEDDEEEEDDEDDEEEEDDEDDDDDEDVVIDLTGEDGEETLVDLVFRHPTLEWRIYSAEAITWRIPRIPLEFYNNQNQEVEVNVPVCEFTLTEIDGLKLKQECGICSEMVDSAQFVTLKKLPCTHVNIPLCALHVSIRG
jgi:hypothetical protein